MPPHDQQGPLSIIVNEDVASAVALRVLYNQSLTFTLTATGDDDAQDCFHSAVTLDLNMKYVELEY